MSDISLLMAGVLTGNLPSLPDQLPVPSPVQPDTVRQNSPQRSSQTHSPAEITHPDFLDADHSVFGMSSVIDQQYQHQLIEEESFPETSFTEQNESGIYSYISISLHPYIPFHTDPEELDNKTEFSPRLSNHCAINQTMNYDEFAISLVTCLQQIDELLTNKNYTIEPEDFILLQRLKNEVKAELAQL